MFIIPKLPAKMIYRSTDGIMQRMIDLQDFINAVFQHPVLLNLRVTNDFLTVGAQKEILSEFVQTREITLDSKIDAPDNEWFIDRQEKIPVSGFIRDYFYIDQDLQSIGVKLQTKENIIFSIKKQIWNMDKNILDFGQSLQILADQLCDWENSDLFVYKGIPLKRIGIGLKRIQKSLKVSCLI
jgi:hypothetical protein